MRRRVALALALPVGAALLAAAVVALNLRGEAPLADHDGPSPTTRAQAERGAYLARAGNCMTCHTERGGAPYAGGRAIDTPFGTVYASNLTPDDDTGIGRWSSAHFWRALHHGRSKDGRLLYPAFPYPNYTQVTREDADALYAYLRTVAPVAQRNRAHALRFPYDSQAALAVWRALFFAPGVYRPEPSQTAEWNRGAYLVRGLGHCAACHAARNWLGASEQALELSGGLIPMQQWYAPSLADAAEAGVEHWDTDRVVALLRTGVAPGATVMGPMADVVFRSTQYLSNSDLRAIAAFLRALPPAKLAPPPAAARVDATLLQRGAEIYRAQCVQCHGRAGEGVPGAFTPLAGNRAVTLASPANGIRVLLSGGYPPATAGNPRPYGMPPFAHVLDDRDIAAVLSYVRRSWGNDGSMVTPQDVLIYRR